jgi:hypothetical protein
MKAFVSLIAGIILMLSLILATGGAETEPPLPGPETEAEDREIEEIMAIEEILKNLEILKEMEVIQDYEILADKKAEEKIDAKDN